MTDVKTATSTAASTARRRRQLRRRAHVHRRVHQVHRAQALSRPLVVHAGRDRAVLVHRAAAFRRHPDGVLRAVDEPGALRRHRSHQLQGIGDVQGLRVDAFTCRSTCRGGLLMRQIHHWAALIFTASIVTHMARIFFTGAFRKPREINWLVGFTLMITVARGRLHRLLAPRRRAVGQRPAHHRRRDPVDPHSRLVHLVLDSSAASSLAKRSFRGCSPRHILLIPGLILGLVALHLFLVFLHKHTQYPGGGRTDKNVVGLPLFPVYTAKAGGFFFVVFGVIALLGACFQINPVWNYGPYDPSPVSAGTQPDWYMLFIDGGLRIMPGHVRGRRSAASRCRSTSSFPAVHHAGALLRIPGALPVDRGVGHGRPRREARARPPAQRPGPHRHRRRAHHVLRGAGARGLERHRREPVQPVDQRPHHHVPHSGVRVARRGVLHHQTRSLWACNARTANWCSTATRPGASSASNPASTSRSTSRSRSRTLGARLVRDLKPRDGPEPNERGVRRKGYRWDRFKAACRASTSRTASSPSRPRNSRGARAPRR